LRHSNIVKYYGWTKSRDHLNIILEYVENGSLQQIVKKFGTFPEPLVCVYVRQVLAGIVYLHEQGVIHRDIKGANILISKDGGVKLTDFGVATKLNDMESNQDVVGTPYWMAPEIIEMTGASSASDIWSVGCTVIELLTGSPPYFDLDPMPALFRIVTDERPPLPEAISSALRDFLIQCFTKDPALRPNAAVMLRHKWVTSGSNDKVSKRLTMEDIEGLARTIKEYNKENRGGMEGLFAPRDSDSSPAASQLPVPTQMSVADASSFIKNEGKVANGLAVPPPAATSAAAQEETETTRATEQKKKQMMMMKQAEEDEAEENWDEDFAEEDAAALPHRQVTTSPTAATLSQGALVKDSKAIQRGDSSKEDLPSKLDKERGVNLSQYAENDEDMDAMFEDVKGEQLSVRLRAKLVVPSAVEDVDESEWEEDEEVDPARRRQMDELNRQAAEIMRLINLLQVGGKEDDMLHACQLLMNILRAYPEQKSHLITYHGVLPILDMMEVASTRVLPVVLQVVNLIILDNAQFQENLCLLGAVPIVMSFCNMSYDNSIRVQAALFIRHMCFTSRVTLQMFIACRGLPVLAAMLQGSFEVNEDVIRVAVACVDRVLSLQSATPRNDFCRLFAKAGLLENLVAVWPMVHAAPTGAALSMTIADFFLLFSQADPVVKRSMSELSVLSKLLVFMKGEEETLIGVKVLKSVRNLTMDPYTLDNVYSSGWLQQLVRILTRSTGPYLKEMHNHALYAMYNLCRITKSRLEAAAVAGVVPALQAFIKSNSPLKEFAFPLYCDLAHGSKATRAELWKHNGAAFYVSVLQDPHWRVNVFDGLAAWLSDDTKRVESVLKTETSVNAMECLFSAVVAAMNNNANIFVNLLASLQRIISISEPINQAIGRSSLLQLMVSNLKHPDASVRVGVLKVIISVYESHRNPKNMIAENNLIPLVQQSVKDKAVIVSDLASQLLLVFNTNDII
jgi:hypothetical protein